MLDNCKWSFNFELGEKKGREMSTSIKLKMGFKYYGLLLGQSAAGRRRALEGEGNKK
jgi:hypothetical protein